MSQLNVFCVTHKKIDFPNVPHLKLIQVGNQLQNFADFRDDLGDNIAHKNSSYSELTAFYYVWKNLPSPFVGFCHYRRYLIPSILSQWIRKTAIKPYGSGFLVSDAKLFNQLTELNHQYQSSFTQALDNYDILLPHPNPLPPGGFIRQYFAYHPSAPFWKMLSIISEIDNRMGVRAHQFFLQSRQAYWHNLFITRWDVFEQYCQFLFEILFELEQEVKLSESPYQQRVFAFLSERLFNFWIWDQKLNIATLDWCILENSMTTRESHQWSPGKSTSLSKMATAC